MVKVDRYKKSRIVQYTKTQPPVTFSYFKKIPRRIKHHIDGNLEITYRPEWLEDLATKVNYDLSEDEEQVRLVDPGGPKAKPQKIHKEELREFLEKHSNGELAGAGFPKGESVAVVPDCEERAKKRILPIVVAEKKKKKEEHTGEGSGIFDEKTEPFEEELEKHNDFWTNPNEYDEKLDYEPEYDESYLKQDPLSEDKLGLINKTKAKARDPWTEPNEDKAKSAKQC